MSVVQFVTEALAEGAFLTFLRSAWNWGKKAYASLKLTDPLLDTVKKRLIDSKTWEDENLLARAFAECNLFDDQKKMILNALCWLEDMDQKSGTHFARSFRILATFDDGNAKEGEIRPSIHILEEIGSLCSTKEEVLLYIMALGGMVDSSTSWEKFLRIAKNNVYPYVLKRLKELESSADEALDTLGEHLRVKNEEFSRLSSWRKILIGK